VNDFAAVQMNAAIAAARDGDAHQAGRVLAHMRREGASAAEVSKAVEAIGDTAAAEHWPISPAMRGVLLLVLDEEAEAGAEVSTPQPDETINLP
jgi:hypothetical protein